VASVLVVAPHPDDESIGCGGSLALHREQGDRITALFLTSGELGLKQFTPEEAWRIREAETQAAAQVLGIRQLRFLRAPDWFLADHIDSLLPDVRRMFDELAPNYVYVPHSNEWHPDHKAAATIVSSVVAEKGITAEIRSFEVWTPLTFFQELRDITSVMDRKLRAIRCHDSQLQDIRYDDAIAGLNRYRGAIARCQYAEVFGIQSGGQNGNSYPPPK
jgi:LmbE family N-acetylglucosaminyl deacetylase